MKLPRHLYIVSRRGARLSHAALGLMRLLKPDASSPRAGPIATKSAPATVAATPGKAK
jgi:hypothetical protein